MNEDKNQGIVLKTDEPHVPAEICSMIESLDSLISEAERLRDAVMEWYDRELKSYDPGADAYDELFDPCEGENVSRISYAWMMDGLMTLQIFNSTKKTGS